jgi:uncharacterized RDD family membrane protein YckC
VVLDIVILSPEKTILTFRLAGLGARIVAHILDVAVVLAVLIASTYLVSLLALVDSGIAMGIMVVLWSLGIFAYFILLEGLWNGQTLGKRVMNLRVRMADGTPVTFPAAAGRNLLRPADMLPGVYLLGMAAMFTNPRFQRIGDIVSDTIVVYEPRSAPQVMPAPHTAGIHPFEDSVGDLPGMTMEEYAALRRFCDRFPEMSPDIQSKLVAEVWAPIAARRKVSPIPNVHPIYLAEAVVMKYGRRNGLL